MKKVLISFALILCAGCSSISKKVTKPTAYPTKSFLFYSGDEETLGDLYVRKSRLKHSKSGKIVTLFGMVHIGDRSFYQQVQEQVDRADLVLAEGVSGRSSLSLSSLFYAYTFAMYERGANIAGLASQVGEVRVPAEKYVGADVTVDELQSQNSLMSTLSQAVALPLTMLFAEPSILLIDLSDSLRFYQSTTQKAERYALRRHFFVSDMDRPQNAKHLDTLIPGVLAFRNERLLKVLDEKVAEKSVKTILVPWGAAHLQDVEEHLLKNGYEPVQSEWIKVVAVNELAEGRETFTKSRKFCLPYVYSYYRHTNLTEHNLFIQLLKVTNMAHYSGVDLGYGHVLKYQGFEQGTYFSLLPSLFGYPLLFEYVKNKEQSKIRMLLFFEF